MGVSKKTLDDYLMNLKKGLSLNFDFKKNLNHNLIINIEIYFKK